MVWCCCLNYVHHPFNGPSPLQAAVSGGLWGPALMLGLSLGDKAWAEAATSMSLNAMSPGAPLRTMTLLSAGRPDLILGGGALSTGVGLLCTGQGKTTSRGQSGSEAMTGGGGGGATPTGGNVIASIFGIGKGGGNSGDQTGSGGGTSETEVAVSTTYQYSKIQ